MSEAKTLPLPYCVKYKGYYFQPCRNYVWCDDQQIAMVTSDYHPMPGKCVHRTQVVVGTKSVEMEFWVSPRTEGNPHPLSTKIKQ